MKNTYFILGLLGLWSCQNIQSNAPTSTPPVAASDSTMEISNAKVHASISYTTNILETDYLLFEVNHLTSNYSRTYGSFESSDGYKKTSSVGAKCWNLMFYNAKTQAYYLLDADKKMLIYNYVFNDTAKGKVVRNWARYDVQFDDNKDGKFTNADAKRLFVSDRLGQHWHQVSPEGVDVEHHHFAPKENFMLLYGRKDTNRDGVFDEKDAGFCFRLDLNQDVQKITVAQPLISKVFQNVLQKKAEIDWKLPE